MFFGIYVPRSKIVLGRQALDGIMNTMRGSFLFEEHGLSLGETQLHYLPSSVQLPYWKRWCRLDQNIFFLAVM